MVSVRPGGTFRYALTSDRELLNEVGQTLVYLVVTRASESDSGVDGAEPAIRVPMKSGTVLAGVVEEGDDAQSAESLKWRAVRP